MLRLAKIVKSNSHVDYVGRVIDRLDAQEPPAPTDYGFGQFVSLPVDEAEEVVGVIYNSLLANPDYGSFGPRLSPAAELSVLSPDYLNEQGALVGILLLGWRERSGAGISGGEVVRHGVPRRVIPVGQEVYRLDDADVREFHKGADGSLQLHYYSQVLAHAGPFGVPLIEAVIAQLEEGCAREERQRLCVLKQALVWQRTIGGMRL